MGQSNPPVAAMELPREDSANPNTPCGTCALDGEFVDGGDWQCSYCKATYPNREAAARVDEEVGE